MTPEKQISGRSVPALAAFFLAILAGPPSQAFFTTVGNDYYTVNVIDDSAGTDSIGTLQLNTGPAHPAGANQPITFGSLGNVNIGTSFSGIRVLGGRLPRDYTSDAQGAGAAGPVQDLDDYFATNGPRPATPGRDGGPSGTWRRRTSRSHRT